MYRNFLLNLMNILFVPKVEETVLEEVVLDEPLSPKFMIDQVGDRIYLGLHRILIWPNIRYPAKKENKFYIFFSFSDKKCTFL